MFVQCITCETFQCMKVIFLDANGLVTALIRANRTYYLKQI